MPIIQNFPNDTIELDQIILTPIAGRNLVQNPGFQLGLANWVPTSSGTRFFANYEGTARQDITSCLTLATGQTDHHLVTYWPRSAGSIKTTTTLAWG
ncbi:MAG: hypothetical protein A4E53_03062 [Pelotomaculum sp. PtaB.Bin104]|nr:MAG: hypothetical protein A4E53_03062 [Pelotomaculum sp. PtaB.Bin104]